MLRVLKNPPGTPDSLLLIDQDVAYFRNVQAASPFKVGGFPQSPYYAS